MALEEQEVRIFLRFFSLQSGSRKLMPIFILEKSASS